MKHEAVIRFLNQEEGGRVTPPLTGYKPHIKIADRQTSCRITSKNQATEELAFGVDHEVFIEFQYEANFADKITERLNIGLYEGKKLIGHGYLIS